MSDFSLNPELNIISICGNRYYYKGNLLHREDGPAIEMDDGTTFWYLHGKYHREDGPAVEWCGNKYWYLNGECIEVNTQEEFERCLKLKAFW